MKEEEKIEREGGTVWYAFARKRKRGEGAREAGGASNKPTFFFSFFPRSRLGVSFDHICILVMKFAPGPVISVYFTDSHSLRTEALIGRFKSGHRCCCYRCILLTVNIFDITASLFITIEKFHNFQPNTYLFSIVSYFSLTGENLLKPHKV